MRLLWRTWWIMGLLIPVFQWPNVSVWESGRLSLAVWAVAAGALGMSERLPKRPAALPILSLLFVLLALWQLAVIWPTVAFNDWTRAWGFVASFSSMACWLLAMCFGINAIIRHSPDVSRYLPVFLFAVLSLNIITWVVQAMNLWSLWFYQVFNSGFFPNQVVWGAWCAISIPILLSWRKWAVIPAIIGLLLSQSSSAVLALIITLFWYCWPKRALYFALYALAGVGLIFWNEARLNLSTIISARLNTWQRVIEAISTHPMGIGWSVMAYGNAIHAKSNVLPHPSSDVLRLILEAGWIAGLLLAFSLFQAVPFIKRENPLAVSLVVCGSLACWQNVLSIAQAGCLALVVWCLWRIQMEDRAWRT